MKSEETGKFFKRKTTSMKLLIYEQRNDRQLGSTETTSKFLSPKNIKGLNSTMYKKDESLIRDFQQEVNKLKQEVKHLLHENSSLRDQNILMKKQIQKHKEAHKNSQNEHFAAVDVLNELKEKIDKLNEDDQLSTVDEIQIEDVCRCQYYERQMKDCMGRVKFLEESLLHSQQIIIKLNEEIKNLKFSKTVQDNHLRTKQRSHHQRPNLNRNLSPKHSSTRTSKTKYKCSSIEEIFDDHEQ